MQVIGIVVAILVFGMMVLVHECGHFFMAKRMGITVYEFSIGMGPKLVQWGKKGTRYSLRLLPIGGFVSMAGENGEEEEDGESGTEAASYGIPPEEVVSFSSKPIWQRAVVLAAGAAMNLLLGLVLAAVVTMMSNGIATMTIAEFDPAAVSSSKLQVGDEIVRINGSRTHIDLDLLFSFQRVEKDSAHMMVRRDGKIVDLGEVPFVKSVDSATGQNYLQLDFTVQGARLTPLNVARQSFYMVGSIVKVVWVSFFELVTGRYGLNDLSGPVGVAKEMGEAFQTVPSFGWRPYLLTVAMITINIGVFNLLPFPALDGGRLVFLLIEKIWGKPVPISIQGYVNFAGLALLLLLMLVVTAGDIGKLLG